MQAFCNSVQLFILLFSVPYHITPCYVGSRFCSFLYILFIPSFLIVIHTILFNLSPGSRVCIHPITVFLSKLLQIMFHTILFYPFVINSIYLFPSFQILLHPIFFYPLFINLIVPRFQIVFLAIIFYLFSLHILSVRQVPESVPSFSFLSILGMQYTVHITVPTAQH